MTHTHLLLKNPQDIAHLDGQACPRCTHPTADHMGNPTCRSCRCSSDPLCRVCGELATKHA